tara:strand:- start:17372 stop:17758 length:387 start_codon:yes stop_codon:yes gene_type:complete
MPYNRKMISQFSPTLDIASIARNTIEFASDKQAQNIVLLDVKEISSITDYMILLNGSSRRQIQSLGNDISENIKLNGLHLLHHEGTSESGWILLDFGDVIVNIFSEEQRNFYQLEEVWKSGRELIRIQ